MRSLLDTNMVSELVRNPQGKVAQHIRKFGEAQVCTSIMSRLVRNVPFFCCGVPVGMHTAAKPCS
jgi:hypothetical protein